MSSGRRTVSRMKRWLIGGIAGGGALVLAAGATAFALGGQSSVQPPTPTVQIAEVSPAPRATPTPTPTLGPVVEVAIPEPVVDEPVVDEPVYVEPEPAGPVLCPSGTSANANDGYNDISCFPDICFNISVPNPEHPECDVAMPPEYYY